MTNLGENFTRKEIPEDNALISFYESLGVRVITQGGYLWHSDGLRLFVPLPCRGPIEPSREDLNSLWKKGAFFLRYPTLAPGLPAYPSYIYLVDDKNYDLASLSKSARSKTKRALQKCHVEKIPADSLLPQALALIEQTFIRQRRIVTRDTFSAWENYLATASKNPLFETWAVFVGSELAAFWDCLIYRGGCYGEGLFSRPDFLNHHVINALAFVSTREIIRRADVDHVSYGMRAMFGDSEGLNSFKESMGYKRLQVGEHIAVAPWLRPAFDNGLSKLIRYVAKKYYYASPTAKRIRAMITTYGSQDREYLAKISVSETVKGANQETTERETMMVRNEEPIFRKCNDCDEEAILALEKVAWGKGEPADPDFFDWQVKRNPAGPSIPYCVGGHEAPLMSHLVVVPVPAIYKGNLTKVGFALNGVTHPKYRRKGLNTALQRLAYGEARNLEIDLIFSWANEQSYGIQVNELGFVDLGKPDTMVYVLDSTNFFRNHGFYKFASAIGLPIQFALKLSQPHLRESMPVTVLDSPEGLRTDKLWDYRGFSIAPDAAWLHWRYGDHPSRAYRFAIVGNAQNPAGLIVYQTVEHFHRAFVMELMLAESVDGRAGESLMCHVLAKSREANCATVWALAAPGSRKGSLLRRWGFMKVPNKWSVSQHLLVRSDHDQGWNLSINDTDISYGSLINYE